MRCLKMCTIVHIFRVGFSKQGTRSDLEPSHNVTKLRGNGTEYTLRLAELARWKKLRQLAEFLQDDHYPDQHDLPNDNVIEQKSSQGNSRGVQVRPDIPTDPTMSRVSPIASGFLPGAMSRLAPAWLRESLGLLRGCNYPRTVSNRLLSPLLARWQIEQKASFFGGQSRFRE